MCVAQLCLSCGHARQLKALLVIVVTGHYPHTHMPFALDAQIQSRVVWQFHINIRIFESVVPGLPGSSVGIRPIDCWVSNRCSSAECYVQLLELLHQAAMICMWPGWTVRSGCDKWL